MKIMENNLWTCHKLFYKLLQTVAHVYASKITQISRSKQARYIYSFYITMV
jgi:hypothetical protein